MPKKKSKTKKTSRNKISSSIKAFYSTRTWLKIFLTFLAIWGLVWVGQVAVERYSFYRAEKTLDSITKQLGENFNLVSAEKDRSCGKRSHAFGESLGGCSVSYSYTLKGGEETARSIDKTIEARKDAKNHNPDPVLIDDSSFAPVYKSNSTETDKFSSTYKFRGASSLDCGVFYSIAENSTLYVYASCYLPGRDAKFQYFPIGG